jgi:hypothetical protein
MRNARVDHILAIIDAALGDVGSGDPTPSRPTYPVRDVLATGGFGIR